MTPTIDPPPSDQPAARKRAVRTALIAGGGVVVVMAGLALAAGLNLWSTGVHGTIALVLGVVATTGLGAGLMALSFYSSRAGVDEAVGMDETAPDEFRR